MTNLVVYKIKSKNNLQAKFCFVFYIYFIAILFAKKCYK